MATDENRHYYISAYAIARQWRINYGAPAPGPKVRGPLKWKVKSFDILCIKTKS